MGCIEAVAKKLAVVIVIGLLVLFFVPADQEMLAMIGYGIAIVAGLAV